MAKNKKKYVHPKPKFKQNWKDESPVKAKKYLGQHFLKDEEVAYNIAHTLSLKGYTNVIEIGPGTGVLTKHLLAQDMNLVAMELDTESVEYLQSNFPLEHPELQKRKGTFKVIEADFLKFDIESLFGNEQFAITGNFPYNISTQIVFKMLEIRHLVPEFSGMFQKEVAKRICSTGGNKAFGILSVLVQTFYDTEYLFTVGPEVFNPPPKVESGVLRLTRKENLKLECDPVLLFKVVKAIFNLRRKTLRNSLKGFDLSDSLREGVIFDKRPEQLAVADFVTLTKMIADDTL